MSGHRLAMFTGVALFMAIAGSWVANGLWNSAAKRLPAALSGQLIVFETLCALCYGCLMVWALPGAHEMLGMLLVLGGVTWAVAVQGRATAADKQEAAGINGEHA